MESDVEDRSRGQWGALAFMVVVLISTIGDARAEEKSAVASMFDPHLTMSGHATPTFMRPQAPPIAVMPSEPKLAEPQPTGATGTVAASAGKLAPPRTMARAGAKIASGRASWYQHPGRTASGEPFRPDGLTAAHRSLPFGSRIRVVNQGNGRSLVLRINDRTNQHTAAQRPYVIDLSRGSARALGIKGLAQVALYKAD